MKAVFGALCVALLSAAQPARVLVQVQGRVVQFSFDSQGRENGLVLDDRTFVRFRPGDLPAAPPLNRGDLISVQGRQVRSRPNRVLVDPALRKGSTILLDESVARAGAVPAPPPNPPALKGTSDSSTILAVGASPDGSIDRLILDDGTTLQIPVGAAPNLSRIRLGEQVSASGAGTQFNSGGFILAMKLGGSGGVPLLASAAGDGGAWVAVAGLVSRLLPTPAGEIDGVLLTNGKAIRFPPVGPISYQISKLAPGTQIQVAGQTRAGTVWTDQILLVQDQSVLQFGPGPVAGAGIAGETVPLTDVSRIQRVLPDRHGEPDTLLLADGAVVRVTPQIRDGLSVPLNPGETVSVSGPGGRYAAGTAIEAGSLRILG